MSQIQALDFSVDLLRALLWQHNEASRLEGLVRAKQTWYDANQEAFWTDWVADVFDLRTANEFGLTVWAIILDMGLALPSQVDPSDKPIWGFGQYRKNFANGNFASIASASNLTLEQKRLVLRLRYFQLTTDGAVPEINRFFAYLFATMGRVYVVDGLNMTARYVFNFALPSALEVVISQFDLLPRPAGVKVDYVIASDRAGFGFSPYHSNFNNGNFHHA
jgi:hypothetical protein